VRYLARQPVHVTSAWSAVGSQSEPGGAHLLTLLRFWRQILAPGLPARMQTPHTSSRQTADLCAPCLPLQEIDELFKIFRVLGTPSEATWPGVSVLPDYKDIFPYWAPRPLQELVPSLDPLGIDVLAQMLRCVSFSRSCM